MCVSDFCQVELRLLAHLSSDPELLRIFTNPQADVFTMLASQWWVSISHTHTLTHTQVLPWSTCQGEFWSYTGFLLPSLPPNLPCFTSHPNSLVAMTTMPTAFFCLSSLGRTPGAGHPADYIVGLLKFVCVCILTPLCECVSVLVQVCAVSLMMCIWCVSYLHSCHPSQTGVCQRAPVKQITILTAPLRLCSVSLSLSLFHL